MTTPPRTCRADLAPHGRVVQLPARQLRDRPATCDYSPRASGVHVLAQARRVDLRRGQDGNDDGDDDHPISWCQRYDGGRSWYTGMGHTAASFSEADYLEHLLGGIEVSAGVAPSPSAATRSTRTPRSSRRSADPTSGTAPLVVQFSSSAIDPNGGPLGRTAYRWEFGDGSSAFGRQPEPPLHGAGHLRRGADRDRPGGQEHDQDDPDHRPPAWQPGTGRRAAGGRPRPRAGAAAVRFEAAPRIPTAREPAQLRVGLRGRGRDPVRPRRHATRTRRPGDVPRHGEGDRRGRRGHHERVDHDHGPGPAGQPCRRP